MVPRGGIGPAGVPGVRARHQHGDFQSDLNFLNIIKTVTYALPVSVCASK